MFIVSRLCTEFQINYARVHYTIPPISPIPHGVSCLTLTMTTLENYEYLSTPAFTGVFNYLCRKI